MMDFREMKTVHLLLQPTEDGWIVMHKKYKTFYGSIACTQTGDTVRLTTAFGENEAQRDEAFEAAVREIFLNTDVSRVCCDDAETMCGRRRRRSAMRRCTERRRITRMFLAGRCTA